MNILSTFVLNDSIGLHANAGLRTHAMDHGPFEHTYSSAQRVSCSNLQLIAPPLTPVDSTRRQANLSRLSQVICLAGALQIEVQREEARGARARRSVDDTRADSCTKSNEGMQKRSRELFSRHEYRDGCSGRVSRTG